MKNKSAVTRIFEIKLDESDPKKFLSDINEFMDELYEYIQTENDRTSKITRVLTGIYDPNNPSEFVAQDINSIIELRRKIFEKICSQRKEAFQGVKRFREFNNSHFLNLIKTLSLVQRDEKCLNMLNQITDRVPKVVACIWNCSIPTYLSLILLKNTEEALLEDKKSFIELAVSWGKAAAEDGVGVFIPGIGTAKKFLKEIVQKERKFIKGIREGGQNYHRVRKFKSRLNEITNILFKFDEMRVEARQETDRRLTEIENLQRNMSKRGCWDKYKPINFEKLRWTNT